MNLCNVGICLPDYTVSRPYRHSHRRQNL